MKQLRNRARRIDGLFSFSAHASQALCVTRLDMLPAVGVHAYVGGAHAVNCRFFLTFHSGLAVGRRKGGVKTKNPETFVSGFLRCGRDSNPRPHA